METLIMIAQLVLGLSILVGLHEFGHLITAKIFGMRVEQYSIGFPPKIFGFKWGETEYLVGAIPLGGYVKIAGMIDESMDKDFLDKEPQPYEFRSKPAWQRLIVMMGGIIVNVITGIIIFIVMVYSTGEQYIPVSELKYGIKPNNIAKEIGLQTGDKIINVNGKPIDRFEDIMGSDVILGTDAYFTIEREGKILTIQIPNDLVDKITDKKKEEYFVEPIFTFLVGDVVPNSAASKAGLEKGDKILAINESKITYFHELEGVLSSNKNKEISIKVRRDEKEMMLQATLGEDGKLGFYPDKDLKPDTMEYSLGESVKRGTNMAFGVVFDQIKGFGKIFRGDVALSKSLSGPIGIAQIFGGTWDWFRFWRITAILSMVLAFMNFLPIPALDGGHVMFLSYEMVSGRKPSDKFLEVSQKVGMVLLLCLMVFAVFNDVFKLIF